MGDDSGFHQRGAATSGHTPEERFGSTNRRRKDLFRGLKRALKNLKEAGVRTVYINGSFTTRKPDPKDVDGCWDPTDSINIETLDPIFLDFSSGRRGMKEKYGVDFFIANHMEGRSGFPFVNFFQVSRDGEPKGIIRIDLGGEMND